MINKQTRNIIKASLRHKRDKCEPSEQEKPPINVLFILERWRSWAWKPGKKTEQDYREFLLDETLLIKDLQKNPGAVIERGIKEGWLE